MLMSALAPPPRAGRREWIGLAVIALPCLLYSMDLTVLYLAVPELTRDLSPSSTQLLWITDVYGFLVAGCLITMGRLGDRIGRRRLLLIGAAAFGVASVLAAFSTSAEQLIASRALLGIAGASLAPSTLSLLRNMFLDPHQRTVAIGVWAASFSVGAAIGPVLGGAMLELFWWGSVFLLAVPVMALLLAVGPRLLPEYRDPNPGRFDLPGAALSLVAVLSLVYGLKQVADDGLGSAALVSLALALAVGAVFVWRQLTAQDPLIDLQLFRAPAFSTAVATNVLVLFAIAGCLLFTAQYLQLVLGYSPLEAGLWTLPSSLGLVVGSLSAPAVVRWRGTRFAVVAGLGLAAAGPLLLTQVEAGASLPVIVTGSVLLTLGGSLSATPTIDLIVGSVPPERAGAASGIAETGTELGGALGIAILGSVGAAIYREQLADAVPSGFAGAAHDGLGSVVAAGGELPAEVLDAAFGAFTSGLQVTAAIAAGLIAALGLVATRLLCEPRAQSAGEDAAAQGSPQASRLPA
jgi:MFS transporter, DHA2 family, multidrug resistance protein